MGAGCSSSVLKKYRDLKGYLHSHECMTFNVVTAFVSESNRPPVILMGENHVSNDSQSGPQSCVTVFAAMNEIVSRCDDPASKIHFVVEKGLKNRQAASMASMEKDDEFSLRSVWSKDNRHSRMFRSGLSVVPFDMFYSLRSFFLSGKENVALRMLHLRLDHVFGLMRMEMYTVFVEMGMSTRMPKIGKEGGISEPKFRMSEDEVESLFNDCFNRMKMEIGQYSKGVYKSFDDENARSTRLARYKRRIMEKTLVANFLEGKDDVPEYTEKDIASQDLVFRPWMFQIMYFIYLFTLKVLEVGRKMTPDLAFATRVTELSFEKIIEEPKLHRMFTFLTRCGDYITYALYLRDNLTEKNTSGDIYVVYGGAHHTSALSTLISLLPDRRRDFRRISKRACAEEDKSANMAWQCRDSQDVTPEEYVNMIFDEYSGP